ncbi:lysozyme inhibitor LprI family protein [Erythrobacter sp.]|jgi:uncharacterized protein YecT (DUF1311 family)|uniref:lysozyme inhibitor LprI family protein n=1 Tax=Erythrobacter sp. TaxID=1042 RepID=UPI002EAE733C|nr:lysozyme inhibitor LprI family protein [Erythrobacter sp.]
MSAVLPALLLLHPGHAPARSPPVPDCPDPVTQQAMNYCAAQDYRAADRALNAQWERTASEMKRRDAQTDAADPATPSHFAILLTAQRAWIALRDAHCQSEAAAFRGGSIEPLIHATCMTTLTEQRTELLRSLLAP